MKIPRYLQKYLLILLLIFATSNTNFLLTNNTRKAQIDLANAMAKMSKWQYTKLVMKIIGYKISQSANSAMLNHPVACRVVPGCFLGMAALISLYAYGQIVYFPKQEIEKPKALWQGLSALLAPAPPV